MESLLGLLAPCLALNIGHKTENGLDFNAAFLVTSV
jgi:hypothetical protein